MDRLIRSRASKKAALTNFQKYINAFTESPVEEDRVEELNMRIEKIKSIYLEYSKIQDEIEIISDDCVSEYTQRDEFESSYMKAIIYAQKLIKQHLRASASAAPSIDMCSAKGSSESSESSPTPSLVSVRSMRDSTKPHDDAEAQSSGQTITNPLKPGNKQGQFNKWLEFHDTFVSMVHNNPRISDINKFHYLRFSLEGEARSVVENLEFTSSNYHVAWDLLCDRYHNKKLLVQNHLRAIMSLKPIQTESEQALRSLADGIRKNLRSLSTLGQPTQHWDTLIIHIASEKLDPRTSAKWEEYKTMNPCDIYSLKAFLEFISARAELNQTITQKITNQNISVASTSDSHDKSDKSKSNNTPNHKFANSKSFATVQKNSRKEILCPLCNSSHPLYACTDFKNLTAFERKNKVKELKLCTNCLRAGGGHQSDKCWGSNCRICGDKHNTLLHENEINSTPNQSSSVLASRHESTVILSTAIVLVSTGNNYIEARAVLDSGSMRCFVTERLIKQLALPLKHTSHTVTGVNNTTTQITQASDLKLKARVGNFSFSIQAFVIPQITSQLPPVNIDQRIISNNCRVNADMLADPHFANPAQVDILIGSDVYWSLIKEGIIRVGHRSLVLQNTELGWIVGGSARQAKGDSKNLQCNFARDNGEEENLDAQMQRFWELENIPYRNLLSDEEQECEDLFEKTVTRTQEGRFCVTIPLKQPDTTLGDSLKLAKRRFLALEKRLVNEPTLKKMYCEFLKEYENLGHMTQVKIENDDKRTTYYMPHHGVLRESSTTTKLRVVFNCSAPTSTGISFNNIQRVGPVVQDDIISILLRFRLHAIIISADIEKMYRQILVEPNQRSLQRIIWRENSWEDLKTFELNTVTYGTASAPYLATRCIKQVAMTCNNPQIAEIIEHDFYVDDLLTGGNSDEEVLAMATALLSTLSAHAFPLRKWRCYRQKILDTLIKNNGENLTVGAKNQAKAPGLGWISDEDQLYFSSIEPKPVQSKRQFLGIISQIYDPLGLLTTCTIIAKIMMQKLWLLNLGWDDKLPESTKKSCEEFIGTLSYLDQLKLPRRVTVHEPKSLELHAFSDASQDAYGACVYIHSVTSNNETQVRLLAAKSRVAPLKGNTTIPRLELCGALVAARLYQKVIKALKFQATKCTFWTDSTIVLGWLSTNTMQLKQFVASRVATIREITTTHEWRYIPTKENPADIVSRGADPIQIKANDLWWSGPQFLKSEREFWPTMPTTTVDTSTKLPEVAVQSTTLAMTQEPKDGLENYSLRFSSWCKLKRTTAYMLRFIHNCKHRNASRSGHLSVSELEEAFLTIVRIAQSELFNQEILIIKQGRELSSKNQIQKLCPFIDNHGVIRVGGRLSNANVPYIQRHPVLLHAKHHVTRLYFEYQHRVTLHACPQLLLFSVRKIIWPLGGRNLARAVVHECVTCIRFKAKTMEPIMGDLPQDRVNPGFPFEVTGVDYAGPVIISSKRGRGAKFIKSYISLFICFTTKAIHLELASDLTKESYIMALKRFINRRGKPRRMYSDNGTNFVGAFNELTK